MAQVEFIFDFASPNAYFAHKVIPEIEVRTGAAFEYTPALLGGIFKLTNNKAPMIAFAGVRGKMQYEQLEIQRFIERHGIKNFQFNPNFPVNTLTIMRAAVAAQRAGTLKPYVNAMFHFMWEEPRKMDDPDVIRAALVESGLDADGLLAASQSPEVKQTLFNNTEQAVERGAFGIPTFFVNGAIFFGKNTLRDVEEEIVKAA